MEPGHNKQKRRENQVFSQIILPFAASFVLIIVSGVFLFTRIASDALGIRTWADISIALIILPLLFLSIGFLLLIILGITLVSNIQKRLMVLFNKLSSLSKTLTQGLTHIAQTLARSVIRLKSGWLTVPKKK